MFFWNSVSLKSSECRQFDLCFLCLFSTQLVHLEVHHSVHFSSVTQSCLTLSHLMDCSMPGFPVHHQLLSLLKLTSIESVIPANRLILSCPLLLLPWNFPSIRVFSSESVLCIRWPNYWSFSFSVNPSNEYSGLISFWIHLFRLVVKPSLKDFESNLASLLNEHNCVVVWLLFGIALLWDWNERWPFLVLWPLLSFPNWLTYGVQHIIF